MLNKRTKKLTPTAGYRFKPLSELFSKKTAAQSNTLSLPTPAANLTALPSTVPTNDNDNLLNENQEAAASPRITDISDSQQPLTFDEEDDEPRSNQSMPDATDSDKNTDSEDETDTAVEVVNSDSEEEDEQIDQRPEQWLKTVTERLEEASEPISPTNNLKLKFKKLKKQWAFTGETESVDFNSTDCPLCDHQHVATLFTIKNVQNDSTLQTASQCITQFRAMNNQNIVFGHRRSRQIITDSINNANAKRTNARKNIRQYIY